STYKSSAPIVSCVIWTNHQVHNNARNRDIEPNREGDPGEPPMSLKITRECPDKCKQHQRNNTNGQQNVRDQNKKIDYPKGPFSPEGCRLARYVVNNVEGQKNG